MNTSTLFFLYLSVYCIEATSIIKNTRPASPQKKALISFEKLYTLSDADNKKEVVVKQGQEFVLKLTSNKSTGYSWAVVKFNNKLLKQSKPTRYVISRKHLIGSGGIELFYFAGLTKGKTELQLAYKRPWEKNVPPAKLFQVTVTVS